MSQRALSRRHALGLAGAATLSPALLRQARAQGADGTLTVAMANNPTTIDPINQISHDAMILGQTVFENLVEYDVDGVLQPQLAVALPDISADKLTYTFDLRQDVKFHDGSPMTAEDVKYSFDYLLDPAHKAVRRSIFARIASVDVLSSYKVRVVLSEPYGPWLDFLTKYMGIFPKGSREKYGDDYFRLTPKGVGTGPGVFEEWRPNDFIRFSRNPHYWRPNLPRWQQVVIKIVPEDATRVAYLLSGQADLIGAPPPRDFNRLRARRGLAGNSRPTLGGWTAMMTNTQRAPFDDVNFRRAVACAIDRKTIADTVSFGMLNPSGVPAPTDSWWFSAEANAKVAFDVAKAAQYLAQSKYAGGAEFDMTLPAEPYLIDVKDIALVVQSQLKTLNIKVNLKMGEFSVVTSQMLKGEHQCCLTPSMSPGEPSYLVNATFTAGQVLSKASGYADPRIAALLRTAFAETDQAALTNTYGQIQNILAEDSPCIWLGFFHAANAWRDRVKDFKVNQALTINIRETGLV